MGIVVITNVDQLPAPLIELMADLQHEAMVALKQEDDLQYEGWYCISIKPMKCVDCGTMVTHLEPPDFHLIVVWEEKDHEKLLWFCTELKKQELDPYVQTYHPMMGSCITWEQVVELYESINT